MKAVGTKRTVPIVSRDQLQDLDSFGLFILREDKGEFNPVAVDLVINRGFGAIRANQEQTAAVDQSGGQAKGHFTGKPDGSAV